MGPTSVPVYVYMCLEMNNSDRPEYVIYLADLCIDYMQLNRFHIFYLLLSFPMFLFSYSRLLRVTRVACVLLYVDNCVCDK